MGTKYSAIPPKSHDHHLVVEGRDDVMVIGSLLKRHGVEWPTVSWHPFIKEAGGIDPLLESIPVAVKSSFTRLGFVLDADEDAAAKWQSVRHKIEISGIESPSELAGAGLVLRLDRKRSPGRLRRLGVWVMPNNRISGELEDFVSALVPVGDDVWPHAQKATSDAVALGAPLGADQRAKGELHAYLAWQKTPGVPMGTALTQQVLDSECPEALSFVAWIRRLFEDE